MFETPFAFNFGALVAAVAVDISFPGSSFAPLPLLATESEEVADAAEEEDARMMEEGMKATGFGTSQL